MIIIGHEWHDEDWAYFVCEESRTNNEVFVRI